MNIMKLNAYRFSQPEMTKMLLLKELFENNGFVIDRFPDRLCNGVLKTIPTKN